MVIASFDPMQMMRSVGISGKGICIPTKFKHGLHLQNAKGIYDLTPKECFLILV